MPAGSSKKRVALSLSKRNAIAICIKAEARQAVILVIAPAKKKKNGSVGTLSRRQSDG